MLFRSERHGVLFNLTPKDRVDTRGNIGQQKFQIEGKNSPLKFDGRKMHINIRLPLEEEIDKLEVYELTSPEPFNPEDEKSDEIEQIYQRRKILQNRDEFFSRRSYIRKMEKMFNIST